MFQGFSPEQFAVVRQLFMLFYAPEGSVLFEQGEAAAHFFILVEGEVGIRYKPEDGPPLVIAHVRSEGVVGWSSAIGGPVYTSSAICTVDSMVLRVRSSNLRKLYEFDPTIGALLLEKLAALIENRLSSHHPQLQALLEHNFSVRLDQTVPAG